MSTGNHGAKWESLEGGDGDGEAGSSQVVMRMRMFFHCPSSPPMSASHVSDSIGVYRVLDLGLAVDAGSLYTSQRGMSNSQNTAFPVRCFLLQDEPRGSLVRECVDDNRMGELSPLGTRRSPSTQVRWTLTSVPQIISCVADKTRRHYLIWDHSRRVLQHMADSETLGSRGIKKGERLACWISWRYL